MNILKKLFKRDDGEANELPSVRFPNKISSDYIKQILGDSGDFSLSEIYLGGNKKLKAELCFIDGVISGNGVAEDVIRPATAPERFVGIKDFASAADIMEHGAVFNHTVNRRERTDDVISDLLAGFCAIIFNDLGIALTFETKTSDKRQVQQPEVEKSVKSAKEAFVETFRTNTSLIRRKLRDPGLRIEESMVGRRSATKIGLIYISGLTNPQIIAKVRAQLEKIDIDAVLSTGSIEEYVSGGKKTPFPQMLVTERPDKFAIGLLEGRVGILVDGIPMAFLLPANFSEFFRVPEDNSTNFIVASILTALRYIALIISVFLPAFYVAVAVYHQQMLPTKLLVSIIESRKDVPFSTAAEVLGMLITFELLQEAALRMPQNVGEPISIIGGLVVGQSAVEAKVVSPVVVIIVALAGITGFTIPNQDMSSALRVCRLASALLSLTMGLYGVMLGAAMLIYHLCTLENFGVAYMSPFVEGSGKSVLKSIIKFPLRSSKRRKAFLHPLDERNQK